MHHRDELKDELKHAAFWTLFWCLFFGALAVYILMMTGCAAQTPLPPVDTSPLMQLKTTQAELHKALLTINIFAVVVTLAAGGLAVYGLITADTIIEKLALTVAAASGVVTIGTYIGLVSLPFAPWILLTGAIGGGAYGGYLLYKKIKKPVAAPAKA
jgi:hypothetical protein